MLPELDIFLSIGERAETVGYDGLTEAEQNLYAISWLEGEAANGSLHQFFWNVPPDAAYHALRGLEAVGATQMAAAVRSAISLFPNGRIPDDPDERVVVMDSFERELDRFSDAFLEYPDPLAALIEKYYLDNEHAFLGPKTLLERWHLRRERGEDTTPVYRSRKIDWEKEAESDRVNSSQPCPICAYPTPDYRPTCKRCDYPLAHTRKP
jgi:hypothetical protein